MSVGSRGGVGMGDEVSVGSRVDKGVGRDCMSVGSGGSSLV